MDIKKWKYKISKSKPYPPDTIRHCNFCRKDTKWTFNPLAGHSQCSECGLRKIPILKNLINSEGKIIEKEKEKKQITPENFAGSRVRQVAPRSRRYAPGRLLLADRKNKIKKYRSDILTKLLNKKVICILSNSITLEGILNAIDQNEIVLMVDNSKVLISKHAITMIKSAVMSQ